MAPFVLDGPINGKYFLAYVENVLVPALSPGDTVLIDNLSSHKSPKVRKAIEAKGAELHFLPRYAPDLNPTEMVFSKLNTLLRKANFWPRTHRLSSATQFRSRFSSVKSNAYKVHALVRIRLSLITAVLEAKTQPVLPSAETAAILFWTLLASGQITMRRVDDWQCLNEMPPN